jgi:hypothetical protein
MTSLANLVRQWQASATGDPAVSEYRVALSLWDSARIAALLEMYPRRNETELISELLTAALDELERAMPYIPGGLPVSEDEEGNPIFADTGPTPRFLELSRKYVYQMTADQAAGTVPDVLHGRERLSG